MTVLIVASYSSCSVFWMDLEEDSLFLYMLLQDFKDWVIQKIAFQKVQRKPNHSDTDSYECHW